MNPRPVLVLVANRVLGITSSRLPLIRRFRGAGWRVVVAAAADGPVASLEEAGAEFVEIPFRRGEPGLDDVRAVHRLRRLYRKVRPALIQHFNTKAIGLGSLALSAAPHACVVATVTGQGFALTRGGVVSALTKLAFRQAFRRADRVVFQNPDDLEQFVHWGLVPRRRVRLVVSSGVDVHAFDAAPRDGDRRTRVSFIGRILRQKGVEEFLTAATTLAPSHPRVTFDLAGSLYEGHPQAVSAEWLRSRTGSSIRHLGHVEDVPALLAESLVVVAPSRFGEGVPRVLLEAAAAAVPVVTTDVPGCRAAVRHGVTGLLVPPRDPAALAAAIDALLRDPQQARDMGRRGRAWMEREFDQEAIVDRMIEVYRELGRAPESIPSGSTE